MARTRVDVQIDAAVALLANYAELFPIALHHLDREIAVVDGYGAGQVYEVEPRGQSELTPVERAAEARIRLGSVRVQLVDDRDAILSLVCSALKVARDAVGYRAPVETERCRDNQRRRDGAMEWGREWCEELPNKAGLCWACYQRERRWREAHGMTGRDLAPVSA